MIAMQSLYQEILEAQRGNDEKMLQLLRQFQPLLAKNARRLGYEDAFDDLQVKLIEVIKYIKLGQLKNPENPYLINYLKRCIENHCIKLSQKQQADKTVPISSLLENLGEDGYAYLWDKLLTCTDENPQIQNDAFAKTLTPYESNVIRYFYVQSYTVKEIAQYYHVSASAISQVKTNALKKLRKQVDKEMKLCG